MSDMTIIDANNLILGRMATEAAKRALLGESIDIVNCERAVITGKRKYILDKYAARRARGSNTRGPFTPRRPDMFVRRAIRGMLPYKRGRGRDAFSRIKCHRGVPAHLADKAPVALKGADISKLPTLKFITVQEICRSMGVQ